MLIKNIRKMLEGKFRSKVRTPYPGVVTGGDY